MSPWYKQFWAWVLILVPTSIFVLGIVTLVIVSRQSSTPDGAVYFDSNQPINRHLAGVQRANLRGLSAVMNFSSESISVGIGGKITESKLKLVLSHPQEPGSEFNVELQRVEEGLYTGSMPSPISAGWHWVIIGSDDDGWKLNGEVHIDDLGFEPDK